MRDYADSVIPTALRQLNVHKKIHTDLKTFTKPMPIDKPRTAANITVPQLSWRHSGSLSNKTSTAQLIRSDAIVVTKGATLLAHHHRFEAARTRWIAGFLLQNQLGLHGRTRMVDHDVLTTTDNRVIVHRTLHAYVSVHHTFNRIWLLLKNKTLHFFKNKIFICYKKRLLTRW